MKRRILALIMAVSMLAVFALLPSCSSSGKKSKVLFEVPAEGYDGSDVNIVFYHTMGQNSTNSIRKSM